MMLDLTKALAFVLVLSLLAVSTVSATGPVLGADADPGARPPPEPRPTKLLSCADVGTAEKPLPQTECEGLEELYDLLGGAGWGYESGAGKAPLEGWRISSSLQICDRWAGVKCAKFRDGIPATDTDPGGEWHVTGVNLHNAGLVGDLGQRPDPDYREGKTPGRALAKLRELRFLKLSRNKLTGEIPTELGQLTKLSEIVLGDNELSGPIPPSLAALPELVSLQLPNNQLSGLIPEGLMGSCVDCADRYGGLNLPKNKLTGTLPSDIGRNEISTLDVRFNPGLDGPIPASYSDLDRVEVFMFRDTGICIPPDPDIRTWLEGIGSVLPRKADCEPGTGDPAAPAPKPDTAVTPAAPGEPSVPGPVTSGPGANHRYVDLLSRFNQRRDALAALAARAEAVGGEEGLDQLVAAYTAWAGAADDYASELAEVGFPPEAQAEADTLIRAAEREARNWAEYAADRDAVKEAIIGLQERATRARVEAERQLLAAMGVSDED